MKLSNGLCRGRPPPFLSSRLPPRSVLCPLRAQSSGCFSEPAYVNGAISSRRYNRVTDALRPQAYRAEVAAILGGKRDLCGGGRSREAEILRPRHVSLSLRAKGCMSVIPRDTRRPTSSRATSACAASMSCTRWAGTPTACRPSATRCAPAYIRPSPRSATSRPFARR